MISFGVGSIFLNMHAKVKHNEKLALVIRATQTGYAKAFKGTWIEHDWKSASHKMVQHKNIGFLMQYHD
jgi:hypothetical protein